MPLPDGFLAQARQLTDATGALLVFDEVVTGFRWAPGGVQQVAGVPPDLTALGKILAGGMPGGAVCGRADVMDQLAGSATTRGRVTHPGTHNAHPLSAAAGRGHAAPGGVRRSPAAAPPGCAAELRAGLTAVFARCGVPGRAYGESSTFHLLFGEAEPPDELRPGRR